MGVEVRPFRSACNLNCNYCYEAPQRDIGRKASYDLYKILEAVRNELFQFTLFGGEPLLMPIEDVEILFREGFERHGGSGIQTNGTLITARHIEIFKKYNVHVGISIDGPTELNRQRVAHNAQRTDELTAKTMRNIEHLCQEYEPPSLIVTLSKTNASSERLPILIDWVEDRIKEGITSFRFHVLEVNSNPITQLQVLSDDENFEAIASFERLQENYPYAQLDMAMEPKYLLLGYDSVASCTWQACDPYTTAAVRGITGEGEVTRCGRADKDGIDGLKADSAGYERYIALYQTPQEDGGCKGCEYFIFCKGHCPGTAIDRDWRNRTRDCSLYKRIFQDCEERMLAHGYEPISKSPNREEIELTFLEHWMRGENPPLQGLTSQRQVSLKRSEFLMPDFIRVVWNSQRLKEDWTPRIKRIQRELPYAVVEALSSETDPVLVHIAPYLLPAIKRHADRSGVVIVEDYIGSQYRVAGNHFMPRYWLCKRSAPPEQGVSANLNPMFENFDWQRMILSILGLGFYAPQNTWDEFEERFATAMSNRANEELNWLREIYTDSIRSTSTLHGISIIKAKFFELIYNANQDRESKAVGLNAHQNAVSQGSPALF